MSTTTSILDTCIQYGVLGILGFVAIKTFVNQSRASNKITKDLLDYVTSEKKDKNDEILKNQSIMMQVITKNQETLIKHRYEIMTELQKLNSSLKTVESDKEQADKIYFKVQEIENSIIKTIKFDSGLDENEKIEE
ncbi:MAG: hypothetical protein M0P49_03475 [Bacilli bacterium]|nr:hypothetical protein [Bacilli bacterium]